MIFVNASPGMRAVPRWAAFVGSKAALRELADSLRLEEAEYGVRVTTVYPPQPRLSSCAEPVPYSTGPTIPHDASSRKVSPR